MIGNELSAYNASENGGDMPLTPKYVEPINPVPSAYYSGHYIPPIDLNLLRLVLEYKQKLFDSRGAWLQRRIDDIALLNDILLTNVNPKTHGIVTEDIRNTLDELNKGGDLTDNNYFFGWAESLRAEEYLIFLGYLYPLK